MMNGDGDGRHTQVFYSILSRAHDVRSKSEASAQRCTECHNWYRWMSTINWINIRNDDWELAGWLAAAAAGGVPSAAHVFDTNKQLNDTCRCSLIYLLASTTTATRTLPFLRHTTSRELFHCALHIVRIDDERSIVWRTSVRLLLVRNRAENGCCRRMRHIQKQSIRSIERRGDLSSPAISDAFGVYPTVAVCVFRVMERRTTHP